jgi:hypothetical protein
MSPILFMPSDRKQGVRNRRNSLGSGESRFLAAVSAPAPSGRYRLDPGAEALAPPVMKWQGRAVVVGCLAWYLVVLCLMVLLGSLASPRSTKEIGPANQGAPAAVAPPEGPTHHQ